MPLPRQSVQKLMRESFVGEAAIRVELAERQEVGRQILERLEHLEGVKEESDGYLSPSEKDRLVARFRIQDPQRPSYYYGGDVFQLLVNDEGELIIRRPYGGEAKVARVEEIESFILAVHGRLRRRRALAAKRKKVRGFKSQAILARVRKLAAELQFEFMIRSDTQKLKLFVKLSDDRAVQLNIPFSRFDQVLPELRTAISSLRDLEETGIDFQTKRRPSWGWQSEWSSPDPD